MLMFMRNRFWDYDPLRQRPILTLSLLLLVFLAAFYLRVNKITQSPPGFYVDETSIGYNAYSIWKTGRDEHGIAWPLFFRAFGDYKNPVFIYSLVPLIAGRGLSVETIRLGAALWGSLGIITLAWLAFSLSRNRLFTILSALVLTLTPWHLHYSRMAFEAISLPTLFILSLASFYQWTETKKIGYGILFSLSLGLSFYSYTTARFLVPFTLGLLIIFFRNHWLRSKWQAFIIIFLILLMVFPIISWSKSYPGSLTARFNQISLWADHPSTKTLIDRFWRTFWGHWHPEFLFISGDTTLRHSSKVSSELLSSWGIFLLLGFYVWGRYLRKQIIWQVIFFLVITFPLAASLTQTSPIATRTLHAVPLFALLIALGIWWSWRALKERLIWQRVWVAIWVLAIFLEFNHYYQHLLNVYPKIAWLPRHGFDGSLPSALTWGFKQSQKENLPLYLSDKIEQVYIQGLFFTKTDPYLWQTQKIAPFQVVSFTKNNQLAGLMVLTEAECHLATKVAMLKTFGMTKNSFDYCIVKL